MTPSTAYSRDLGDELRRLRETCTGLKSNELAKKYAFDEYFVQLPGNLRTVGIAESKARTIIMIRLVPVPPPARRSWMNPNLR
jgi:hypothetical protein